MNNWEQIAQATVTSAGIQGDVWLTLEDIPVGSQGLLKLEAFGVGPLFDLAGTEWVVQQVFTRAGLTLTVEDCYGEGWNTAYIHFKGSPLPVIALLAAIGPVLYALGIIIAVVTVSLFLWSFAKEPQKFTLPFLVIGGLVLGGLYLSWKGKR